MVSTQEPVLLPRCLPVPDSVNSPLPHLRVTSSNLMVEDGLRTFSCCVLEAIIDSAVFSGPASTGTRRHEPDIFVPGNERLNASLKWNVSKSHFRSHRCGYGCIVGEILDIVLYDPSMHVNISDKRCCFAKTLDCRSSRMINFHPAAKTDNAS